MDLHALVLRQLRRAGLDAANAGEAWRAFLESVSRAYSANDHDRYLLERSLDLTSQEMQELYRRIEAERDRLQRELEIARVLQTSILPNEHACGRYEIAATMIPATEAGGDYYDVVAVDDGCWLGIGDVAGHGLRTAVIMLMVQSIVAALARSAPAPEPSDVLAAVNRALWDNIRKRLRADEHVTCTLFRCGGDGRVRYAGAHEDFFVVRGGGACERFETRGSWLGAIADVTGKNEDRDLVLGDGDTLVLFTDGITEARDATRAQFGLQRLQGAIEEARERPVAELRAHVVTTTRAFMAEQSDDLTVLVARYRG